MGRNDTVHASVSGSVCRYEGNVKYAKDRRRTLKNGLGGKMHVLFLPCVARIPEYGAIVTVSGVLNLSEYADPASATLNVRAVTVLDPRV